MSISKRIEDAILYGGHSKTGQQVFEEARKQTIAIGIFDGNRTVGRSKPGIEVGSLDRWDIYEGEDNEDDL